MDRASNAVDMFCGGFNCSQAVLSVFSERFGLDEKTTLRLACGFGAGMGRLQKTCGAVTGAYMVLGLQYGSFNPDAIAAARELTYETVREFSKEFEKRNGSTVCMDIMDVDFVNGDKELASSRVAAVCPKLVRDAVEIVSRIIAQYGETDNRIQK